MGKAKAATTEAARHPLLGRRAPSFSAITQSGETVRLADLKGKTVVLYFYPKDNTPGCTKEACSFRDAWARLKRAGVVVLGVSGDSQESHRRFAEKYDLPFPLLVDKDHSIAEKYGVWREKKMAGRTSMGIVRTTFVIDPAGKVVHVFDKVNTETHGEDVLAWIRENLGSAAKRRKS